jgi:hypothetical protein
MNMKSAIEGVFKGLALAFDKIPFLDKFKGYRTVLGLVGLALVLILKLQGVGSPELLQVLEMGFGGFAMLALNAKGRE